MEIVAGLCDSGGVFSFGELCEVCFVAGAEFEGDASPLGLGVGVLHELDVALEIWVYVAGSGDFEKLDECVLSNAHDALFGAGVEAGCDDGGWDGQYDDSHDEEGQERRVSDLAPELCQPVVGVSVVDSADARELPSAGVGCLVVFVVADVHGGVKGSTEERATVCRGFYSKDDSTRRVSSDLGIPSLGSIRRGFPCRSQGHLMA